jgi:hypothetical protein
MRKFSTHLAVLVAGIALGAASLALAAPSRQATASGPSLAAIYRKVSTIQNRLGTAGDIKPHGRFRSSLFGIVISMETDADRICKAVKGGC